MATIEEIDHIEEVPREDEDDESKATSTRSKLNAIERSRSPRSNDEDEDIDETLSERLMGLTEMFPQGVRNLTCHIASFSKNASLWCYSVSRTALWVSASSACILALPVMFESERAQMEEQQLQQERQILLGPNAATTGGHLPMPHLTPVSPQ